MNQRLSIVIPCFNEEESLHELRRRLIPVCEAIVGNSFEVVLVDDGSTDSTRSILRAFQNEDTRFVAVGLSRNFGHQLALTAGLSVARGERVLVLDADLQDPPELLEPMMQTMDQGFDVVYGRRRTRKGESNFKRASAAFFYRLLDQMVDVRIPVDSGDFRLLSRRAVDIINSMPEQNRFIRGMISWIGFRQNAFEYDRDERFAGVTKYPLKRMIRFAIDAITGFSVLPLKLATWTGFACAVLAAITLIYVLISWATGEIVQGWTSLMVIVLTLGAAQLMMIGILGEYIGRLYMQSKARPLFIIEELIRNEQPLLSPKTADTEYQQS